MTRLPTGGEVRIPSPYLVETKYPNKAAGALPALVAYRNWRSTMSGHPDCDGMLAVGDARHFKNLRDFVGHGRAALSIAWGDADRIPKQAWTGNEKRYAIEEANGLNGRELTQQLAVHRSGWFDVYDQASMLYAVDDRRGLMAAVWIFDSHGGLSKARRLADELARSFTP